MTLRDCSAYRYRRVGFLAFLLVLFPGFCISAENPVGPSGAIAALSSRNIFDCADVLERRGGGWCELNGAAISDVFPQNLDPAVRMATGPRAVIDAWNGAAFDPARLILYFHGGGHRDYGGNEVYSFDLRKGEWRRLTDPAPVPPPTAETPCPVPASSPPASRTYDGSVYSRATQTIWLFPSLFACSSRMLLGGREFWEFNPSPLENRNGLAPLGWRKHGSLPSGMQGAFFRTAALSDGRIHVGTSNSEHVFDPRTLAWDHIADIPNRGSGTAVFDPARKLVWTIHDSGLYVGAGHRDAGKYAPPGPGIGRGAGLAVDDDGVLTLWNGGASILRFDPKSRIWRLIDNDGQAPSYTARPVYSRWVYVPALRVYVGYADFRRGIWVYRLPDRNPGRPAETVSIQPLLDAAAPGATVSVPPGIYRAGAVIRRPVLLRLKNVRIVGQTAGKGVLFVRNANGPVVIEDFATRDPVRCGNCAGIKIEGVNFDVTVRRARIAHAEMGILTGNRGGRLVVEDSLIEDIGHDRGAEPMHLIYAGVIDQLIVRRSTLRRSHHLGHLLKSRARGTDVRESWLLGLGSHNSREADLPCGGRILFDKVVIQKGAASDNDDSIAVATEPANCAPYADTSFTMTRSWVVFDRPDGQIGTWGIKKAIPVVIADNRFVGSFRWEHFPPAGGSNRFFPSRAAAGLGARQIPSISGVPAR